MKISFLFLISWLSFFSSSAFSEQPQTQSTVKMKFFKSFACDDSGYHCFALAYNAKKKNSLAIHRTDDAGENWYKLNTDFYQRIGSDETLDDATGMKIACDQYLQNCLMGVTVLNGHAFVFYGTNDSGRSWKGTMIWHGPNRTSKEEHIVELTCNPSTGSLCHLLTDTHGVYILEPDSNPVEITGPDALGLTMRPMGNH